MNWTEGSTASSLKSTSKSLPLSGAPVPVPMARPKLDRPVAVAVAALAGAAKTPVVSTPRAQTANILANVRTLRLGRICVSSLGVGTSIANCASISIGGWSENPRRPIDTNGDACISEGRRKQRAGQPHWLARCLTHAGSAHGLDPNVAVEQVCARIAVILQTYRSCARSFRSSSAGRPVDLGVV